MARACAPWVLVAVWLGMLDMVSAADEAPLFWEGCGEIGVMQGQGDADQPARVTSLSEFPDVQTGDLVPPCAAGAAEEFWEMPVLYPCKVARAEVAWILRVMLGDCGTALRIFCTEDVLPVATSN
eukprot:CAMPEP_0203914004 /NCGR_PEP_ID=MMETSP0359-20131031/54952_1 /ASSEMBLY_ACC=CAM_ASM_000338 /TAXON_ID=268821 /ORGANISM="Scrippsiella Hangoei, Strain SHTV-5" /LENGTH=124 /DNA_ID=CAMNT_0050840265 /DNA_START=21 /DNA_END=392 /DNA_ORIENTATION=+